MLRFAQHDKTEDVIPNAVRNPVWMLRFAQHDRPMLFRTLFFVIPSVSEESTHGCFTALSMTNWWMLRFVQHDKLADASLRSA